MTTTKMTKAELQAVFSIAGIMALRLIGLFMIIPIFSYYTKTLNASTPLLIGVASGIYGLTQGLFQLPFGMLSDRFGRKPLLFLGLAIFGLGSVVCALSTSIYWIILGRCLQGAGAIGSTAMALLADLTREDQRTKAMAIFGSTIGLSFTLAMILGPVLAIALSVSGIFWLAGVFSVLAGLILFRISPATSFPKLTENTPTRSFFQLFKNGQLLRLDLSVLLSHAMFTATFVALPLSLKSIANIDLHHQWTLYLPALTVALFVTFICIFLGEKKGLTRHFFLLAILAMLGAEDCFVHMGQFKYLPVIGLSLFFAGFSLIEAYLPSWVSRSAPAERRGAALGIYSSAQFLGIFLGGTSAGYLYGQFGLPSVYLFCITLTILWLPIALGVNVISAKAPSTASPSTRDPNPTALHE